jgi:hypothetical protein
MAGHNDRIRLLGFVVVFVAKEMSVRRISATSFPSDWAIFIRTYCCDACSTMCTTSSITSALEYYILNVW